MLCRALSDHQLWAYLDRDLPAVERGLVEAHVTDCSVCSTRLARFRRRPLVLGGQQFIAPPPDFHRRVMARIAIEAQPAWRTAERNWLALLLTARRVAAMSAAALVLALSSAVVVGAVLATPAVQAAVPSPGTPLANDMVLVVRQALQPLGPFFRDWGWFVLLVGMLAGVMVLSARALAIRLHGRS